MCCTIICCFGLTASLVLYDGELCLVVLLVIVCIIEHWGHHHEFIFYIILVKNPPGVTLVR
jgi:hypothetical protein